MSGEPQAGTPEEAPVVSESAGSAGEAPKDGSETAAAAKPVDAALAMTWKAKAEKYNELERSGALAALEAPPAAPTPQGEDGDGGIPGLTRSELELATYAVRNKVGTAEDFAKLAFAVAYTNAQRSNGVAHDVQLAKIPEAEREGTDRFYKSGDYRTMDAARKAWKGSLPTAEYNALYGEKKPEPKPRDEARPEPVDTSTASIGPNGTERRLDQQKWLREMRSAKERDDRPRIAELTKMARGGPSAD